MLLLTRRINEKLTIGDNLEITLIWIKNRRIKIEIYNKKTKNNNLEVLTLRKFFQINKEVSIIVTYEKRKQVTFGIRAPKHIAIHRYEVYLKILAGIPMK